MTSRSKLGLILGAVAAAAVIGGLAGAQTPAASPAPAAKTGGCCPGHAGKEAHDHSKCPMHAGKVAEGAAAKKDGSPKKCPYAGAHAAMHGAAEAKDAPVKDTAAKAVFVCPMHPEVTSDQKDRCPKCGMFLEEKKP